MLNIQKILAFFLIGWLGIYILMFFAFRYSNQIASYFFLAKHWPTPAMYVLKTLGKDTDFYNHFLQGRIYFVQGELDQSINSFSRSIELNPEFAKSYYNDLAANKVKELNPIQFLMSVMSMCVFPFLSKPILCSLVNISNQDFDILMNNRPEEIKRYVRAILTP